MPMKRLVFTRLLLIQIPPPREVNATLRPFFGGASLHNHRSSAGLRSGSIARFFAGTAGSETGAPPADAHVGGSVKMRTCSSGTVILA